MTLRSDRADLAVLAAVAAAGGVSRRTTLAAAGHPKSAVARLVEAGRLLALRRLWVALPDADPLARAAAARGVVTTCVTLAGHLGLWVRERGPAHVAAAPHSARIEVAEGAKVHWAAPLVPRHPDALFDSVENMLALVATCQPFEDALAIWESALRRRLVDPLALGRLPLDGRAVTLLQAANPFTDSGLETYVRIRLKWLGLRIQSQAWIAGHRVDFLIGDRLVLQIDGGHHVGAQRESDIEHDARLTLMGFHVIRVGYRQVMFDWPSVQDLITRAIAQGLHLAA